MNINANSVIVEEEDYEGPKRKKKKNSTEQIKINAESKKGIVKNIEKNANKELLKVVGFGLLGACLYPAIPTIAQAITEHDMSGWKGLIMGVGLVSLVGLAVGKPEMTVGACSAAGTHLLYAKGTKTIEDITNTQIFRMNPDSVVYSGNTEVVK
jgi:hypothetical protein